LKNTVSGEVSDFVPDLLGQITLFLSGYITKQTCLRFYNQHQQLLAQQQQQLSGKQPPPAASSGKKGAAKRGKDSHLSQVSSFLGDLSKELNLSCS
jgi:hypothetical protein